MWSDAASREPQPRGIASRVRVEVVGGPGRFHEGAQAFAII
jgi:hypothetical protein